MVDSQGTMDNRKPRAELVESLEGTYRLVTGKTDGGRTRNPGRYNYSMNAEWTGLTRVQIASMRERAMLVNTELIKG